MISLLDLQSKRRNAMAKLIDAQERGAVGEITAAKAEYEALTKDIEEWGTKQAVYRIC